MINILIMDHQRNNRQKIRHYIEDYREEHRIVAEVTSVEQAERLLNSQPIDLIIGDDASTGKTGLQLFNDYRDKLKSLHMILFTDNKLFSQSKETLSNGRVDYLHKPIRKADVLISLRQMTSMIITAQQNTIDTKALRYSYEDNILQFKERFLMNLIYGSIRRNDYINNQFDYFNIPYKDSFTVAVFKLDDYRKYQLVMDDDQMQFLIFRTFNLIDRHLASERSGIAFISRYDEVTMLYLSMSEQMDIIESCNRLHSQIHESLEFQGTIGIGSTYNDSRHIHLSYNQAVDAVLEHDYLGRDTVIHINYVADKKDLAYAYGPEQENIIIKYALSGQLKNSLRTLHKVLTAIRVTADYDQHFYKAFAKKIQCHLYRDALAYDYPLEQYLSDLLTQDDFDRVKDLDSAYAYLQKVLTHICHYIVEEKVNQDQKLLENTLKYVQAYYTSRISLISAAQYLMTTPKHLEDIIYRIYEKSFYEFCITVRLENAKELLLDSSQNITEISTAVGFTNTEYFVAIFKQHTNMTPSEYRHQNKDTADLPIKLNVNNPVTRFPRRRT